LKGDFSAKSKHANDQDNIRAPGGLESILKRESPQSQEPAAKAAQPLPRRRYMTVSSGEACGVLIGSHDNLEHTRADLAHVLGGSRSPNALGQVSLRSSIRFKGTARLSWILESWKIDIHVAETLSETVRAATENGCGKITSALLLIVDKSARTP